MDKAIGIHCPALTGAADCGAWDYHPDEPEDEGEAVSSREARETDGETSVAPYRRQTRRDLKTSP
jgi:hypothetical protein